MYRILILCLYGLLLEIAIRSDLLVGPAQWNFPVGPAGNNFYFLGPFWAGIIKFYILRAGPASTSKAFL